MPIEIVRNDITKMTCDAIVNAANTYLMGGGGVDGAIHRAAGRELLEECRTLGGCNTGEAKLTKGYKLPCKYVIHTVGPVWRGGGNGERELLTSCYKNSLLLAVEHGCESVAFPLISSGIYGYPKDEAFRVATDTISNFLAENDADMMVYIVIFDRASLNVGSKMFSEIQSFIDENYVDEQIKQDSRFEPMFRLLFPVKSKDKQDHKNTASKTEKSAIKNKALKRKSKHSKESLFPADLSVGPNIVDTLNSNFNESFDLKKTDLPEKVSFLKEESIPNEGTISEDTLFSGKMDLHSLFGSDCEDKTYAASPSVSTLDEALSALGESFSEMLLRMIDERGLTDPKVYQKANVDRRLFSKIRGNRNYHPQKRTVLAFAIALELGIEDTKKLLETAGFALSKSSISDVIISYFILKGHYNIYEINEVLNSKKQKTLGI